MKRFFFIFAIAIPLLVGAAACGGDDDDDDDATDESDSPGVVTPEGDDGDDEENGSDTPAEAIEVEGSEATDGSDDLVELLSLVPAADVGEVAADITAAIDIQSASLVVEGAEIVLTMTVAGEIGAPEDFTRGYDFAFDSEAFVEAERGVYQGSTLIIGAERSGGAWTVIRKQGPDAPLPFEGATVTIEGSTVVIRVPFAAVISTGDYIWRAISFHTVSTEFTVADVAPDGPGFVRTPLPEAPESTGTPPSPQDVTPVPTP